MARMYETNDRVIMVEDGVVRHGVIEHVFESIPNVVIVKFDNGDVEKVNPQRLAIEPVEKKEEPKAEEPKVEESKSERLAQTITITRGEMNSKLAELTVDLILGRNVPAEVGASAMVLMPIVIAKLFDDPVAKELIHTFKRRPPVGSDAPDA